MEIKVFVEIPALDHLAEALNGKTANCKEVQIHTEMNTTSAAAPVSVLEPAVAMPTSEHVAVTQAPVQGAVTPVQTTTAPMYTRDQLAKAATDHLMPQRMQELTSLLASFSVHSLMDLPEARFGEFATALRGLGAKI